MDMIRAMVADHLMRLAHHYQPPSFLDGLMGQLCTISCPTTR
jgi:hypothetical protein